MRGQHLGFLEEFLGIELPANMHQTPWKTFSKPTENSSFSSSLRLGYADDGSKLNPSHSFPSQLGCLLLCIKKFHKRISNCQEILLLLLRTEVNCILFCFLSCCNQSISRICEDRRGIMSLSLQSGLWVSSTPTAVIPQFVTSNKPER